MNLGRSLVRLVLVLVPAATSMGLLCEKNPTAPVNRHTKEFEYCWEMLDVYFVFRDSLPPDPYIYRTPDSLYASVREPWTVYYYPTMAKRFLTMLTTQRPGMGIRIDSVGTGILIEDVVPNSPAEKAGFKVGDTIVSVDGNSVVRLPLSSAADLLHGTIGSTKSLRVKRGGSEVAIAVTLAYFLGRSVETVDLDSGRGLIYLSEFSTETCLPGGTAEEFQAALRKFDASHYPYLILDMWNNPGGELDQCVSVCSEFVPANTPIVVATERDLDESTGRGFTRETEWKAEAGKQRALNREFYVIQNDSSASAAEILISCIRSNRDEIPTIGKKTYGKGRGQIFSVTPDSGIAKATYAVISPVKGKGVAYDRVGIPPTVPLDAAATDSAALEAAKTMIRQKAKPASLSKAGAGARRSAARTMAAIRRMREEAAPREWEPLGVKRAER